MKTENYDVSIEQQGVEHAVKFEVCISDENVVIAIMPKEAMDYWYDQDPETGVAEPHEETADFFGYREWTQNLLYDELEEKLLADKLDCVVAIEQEKERLGV